MYIRSIIAFTLILGSSFCSDNKRYKRVTNGIGLNGRPTTYTAIRWFGVMTTAWNSYYARKFLGFLGDNGDIWCGGALLTPKIFQTACHCISTPDHESDDDYMRPVTVDHHWAGRATIFFGVSKRFGEESMETYYPVLTEKFIVHQKCVKIGNIYSDDFGIIVIPYNWTKVDDTIPYPWTEIEYAPLYNVKTMREFFYYALKKQLVCLNLGFGTYSDEDQVTKSDFLRTGWAVIVPEKRCYQMNNRIGGRGTSLAYFTWICGEQFPNHYQPSGRSDSGGPISCQNKYFGVTSARSGTIFHKADTHTLYAPIYYNLFVNAIEYREDLIHSVDDLQDTFKSIVDEYYRTSTKRPRPPGFLLKMHDTGVLEKEGMEVSKIQNSKVSLFYSQGSNHLSSFSTLNFVICVHIW